MRNLLKVFNKDCLEGMLDIPDESIDVILTDPPYLYLKNQKLDRAFDEKLFFSECKRVLKKDGFIVLFGRGTSFYRWNTMLAELGFVFKEEIVWDKSSNTSPVTPINRVHETISIHTKLNGAISKNVFIPYTEAKFSIESIQHDIKRIISALKCNSEMNELSQFLENRTVNYLPKSRTRGNATTVQSEMLQQSRLVQTMQAITRGLKEKSIVRVNREYYTAIHPTQKPVRLLERLLALVSVEGDTVLDPFAGSFSTAEACHNLNRKFIGYEIDEEFFKAGKQRLEGLYSEQERMFNIT